MADPSPRTELRKRRQRGVASRVVAVVVVVLRRRRRRRLRSSTRGDDSEKATPRHHRDHARRRPPRGVSASIAATPLRSATTKGGDIAVYAAPDANGAPVDDARARRPSTRCPRSFLAFDQYQDWLHVYLPTRPNSSTGWIKASDVTVSQPLEYQIKVILADHKLTLLHNGVVEFEAPRRHRHRRVPHADGHLLLHRSARPREPARHRATACSPSGCRATATCSPSSPAATARSPSTAPTTRAPSARTSRTAACGSHNDVILKLSTLPLGTPVVIS